MTTAVLLDRTALLEKLAAYGRNGTFALLEEVSDNLQHVADGGKSCRIPLETSFSVLNQCIRVLKNSHSADRKKSAWHILFFMCDRQYNSLASEVLTEVESTDIFKLMPKTVASLTAENDMEANGCFQFIACFGRSNDNRPSILVNAEGLMESLLLAIDTKFEPLRVLVKGTLLLALINTSPDCYPGIPERFIRKNGFRIINKSFQCVYFLALRDKSSREAAFTVVELNLLSNCLGALYCMFRACAAIDAATTAFPKAMFSYDPAGFIKATSTLFDFFALSDHPIFVQSILPLLCAYFWFVEKVHPELLEFALLYRGKKLSPTTYAGVPMIIHAVLLARDPQFQHFAETAEECMLQYLNRFPAVDRLYNDILLAQPVVTPTSGPAPHVCALPGCYVSSISGDHILKQCSRCRAIYYCAEDHQKLHWKEHKLVCVRKEK